MIPLSLGRPFLPDLATRWLQSDPGSRWQRIAGSMLFIDISGFTAMSERLARQGRVGAEEVTSVISDTFGHLLAVAQDNGGSLLKFGGDAMVIFFEGDGHPARAVASAAGMRQELRGVGRFVTSAGRVTLRMSAGVHAGTFHFFLVGGSHRELIVTGPAVSTMVRMEAAAQAGQVLMSPELAALLPAAQVGTGQGPGRLLKGSMRRGASKGIVAPRDDAPGFDVSSLIPISLRATVSAGAIAAEHRTVTVAFVRFVGTDALITDYGVGRAAEALDDLMSRVQAATERHQVSLLASDVAEDGGKVILCAGAPTARGDDEERMLLAAHEISSGASELAVGIGVARGPVFAGAVGPDYRRTYTVMGDTVNLAARLMARAADGQVLATPGVIEGSRTAFELTPLDPFAVKGKKRPVTASAVGDPVGRRARTPHTDLPLIGRTHELGVMLDAWARAQEGTGRFIEVVADAGLGKSRLVAAFLEQAAAPRLLRTEPRAYQSDTPYFSSQGVLRQALGLEGLSEADAVDRLIRLISGNAPELEPWSSLIGVPLELDIAESAQARLLNEEFRRLRLEDAVSDLLGAVLTQPTILLFEDTHSMDDASRQLIRRLSRDLPLRPWLICTTRHPGEGLVAADQEGAVVLELPPLDETGATALIREAAGEALLLPHQVEALAARARGNPLFLIELVHALQRGEDVETLPQTVEGLIHARIDRLPPRDRTALRHLSVLGLGFDVRHAGVVLSDWGAAHPQEVLARLEGFVAVDGAGWCEFDHALIREAAYSGLPYRSRRHLHARVAESILEAPEETEEHAALLSTHFFHAGRWEEAWSYSRTAGEGAKRRYANVEAAAFYDRALLAARRLDSLEKGAVAQVSEALGDVSDLSGRYTEAGNAFRAARRLVDDPLAVARLRLKEAWIEEKRGRYTQALRGLTMGHREIEALSGAAAESMLAQLDVWRAAMRLLQGRFEEAITWAERAEAEAERGDDRDALAHALYLHDAAAVFLGRQIDESRSRRALEIYEELGNLAGQAIVANNLAGFAYFAGRWTDAVGLYERSRAARLQSGDPVEAVRAGAGIGEILCDQGDLSGARAVLAEALAVWRAARYPFGVAFVVSQLGRVASREGSHVEAARLYDEARGIYDGLGARSDVLETDTRIVENLIYQGRTSEAADQIVGAFSGAADLGGDPVQLIRLHLLAGYAAVQRGDTAAAGDAFTDSLALARRRGASYEVALGLEAIARLRRLEAQHAWRDGLSECWSIFDGLGVVSVPLVPLASADAAASALAVD